MPSHIRADRPGSPLHGPTLWHRTAIQFGSRRPNSDVMSDNPGVHRLFAHFRIGCENITTRFTAVAE